MFDVKPITDNLSKILDNMNGQETNIINTYEQVEMISPKIIQLTEEINKIIPAENKNMKIIIDQIANIIKLVKNIDLKPINDKLLILKSSWSSSNINVNKILNMLANAPNYQETLNAILNSLMNTATTSQISEIENKVITFLQNERQQNTSSEIKLINLIQEESKSMQMYNVTLSNDIKKNLRNIHNYIVDIHDKHTKTLKKS
jgi:hypothetical protein